MVDMPVKSVGVKYGDIKSGAHGKCYLIFSQSESGREK